MNLQQSSTDGGAAVTFAVLIKTMHLWIMAQKLAKLAKAAKPTVGQQRCNFSCMLADAHQDSAVPTTTPTLPTW